MRHASRTRRRAAVVLMLALSVAAAGKASAAVESSGGFKYVYKGFTLKPGKPQTTKAKCPKRTHVLSGGHYSNGQFGDVIGLHNYPYDGDDRGKKPRLDPGRVAATALAMSMSERSTPPPITCGASGGHTASAKVWACVAAETSGAFTYTGARLAQIE